MLPGAKIGWGIATSAAGLLALFLARELGLVLLIVGGVFLAIGFSQRNQPKWRVRGLIRKALHNPENGAAQLHQTNKAVSDLDRLYALSADYPNLQDAKDKMKSGTYELGIVHAAIWPG